MPAVFWLIKDVVDERISTVQELLARIKEIHDAYGDDEWDYVCTAAEQEYGFSPANLTRDSLIELAKKWESVSSSLNSLVLENTKSEFSKVSMISYGLDLDEENRSKDFKAVRGTFDTNPVVAKLLEKKELIQQRMNAFTESLKKLG